MTGPPRRILLSAGEASGDRLGAGLARALLRRRPDLELVGMGGERMEAAGVRRLQDSSEISVVGLVEVLARLPAIRRAMKRLGTELTERPPDLLVPIDFPDFNLRLARRAAQAGVPVVYYVGPQIWAWRRGRVHTIRRLVRRMLVLFRFETEVYEQGGVPVTFVGYPVDPPAQVDREAACRRWGLDPSRPVVALMPGSREGEVERQLPGMLGAARRLREARSELQFLVPRATGLPADWLAPRVHAGLPEAAITSGEYPGVLGLCEAGIVAAGTATLDAALAGLPSVVVYRMNALTHAIGTRLVRIDHVALPNLIVGRRVFPEKIQDEYEPAAVAREVSRLLEPGEERQNVLAGLASVREALHSEDAFEAAATAVLDELDRVPPPGVC